MTRRTRSSSPETPSIWALYTHFDCEEFGHGNVETYLATMERLDREIPGDVKLYCSHNDFIAQRCKLGETAEGMRAILANKDAEATGVALGHTYLEGGKPVAEYPCDGFSIVYKTMK